MRTREINPSRLSALRGKRSREAIAHELRKRGHGTDAKSIWRYETGRNQPSSRILADYADVLGAKSVEEMYLDDSGNGSDDDEEAEPVSELLMRAALHLDKAGDYEMADRLRLRVRRAKSIAETAKEALL